MVLLLKIGIELLPLQVFLIFYLQLLLKLLSKVDNFCNAETRILKGFKSCDNIFTSNHDLTSKTIKVQ